MTYEQIGGMKRKRDMCKVDGVCVKTLSHTHRLCYLLATNILSSSVCVLTGVNPDATLGAADEKAGSIFL